MKEGECKIEDFRGKIEGWERELRNVEEELVKLELEQIEASQRGATLGGVALGIAAGLLFNARSSTVNRIASAGIKSKRAELRAKKVLLRSKARTLKVTIAQGKRELSKFEKLVGKLDEF